MVTGSLHLEPDRSSPLNRISLSTDGREVFARLDVVAKGELFGVLAGEIVERQDDVEQVALDDGWMNGALRNTAVRKLATGPTGPIGPTSLQYHHPTVRLGYDPRFALAAFAPRGLYR